MRVDSCIITFALAVLTAWTAVASAEEARAKLEGEGTKWVITPQIPKFASVIVRFEDPDDEFWPAYVIARGVGGQEPLELVWAGGDNLVPQGTFVARAESIGGVFSKRHPRVIEPLIPETGPPQLTVTIVADDPEVERVVRKDSKGREKTQLRWPAECKFEFDGGRKIELDGRLQRKVRTTNGKPYVAVQFRGLIDGDRLGGPAKRVEVVVEAQAGPEGGYPKKKNNRK